MSVWNQIATALRGLIHADTPDGFRVEGGSAGVDRWGDPDARRLRYAIAWAMYQSTAFHDGQPWARDLRTLFRLTETVRNIHNPAAIITEFAASHVFAGAWDLAAGDGKAVPSAAPIVGDAVTPELRAAIGRVWRDSLWPNNVEGWVRNGAMFGDGPVKVVADLARGKVLFDVVHPETVKFVGFDAFGHVLDYVIERVVVDPREPARRDPTLPARPIKRVVYEERCYRDGEAVVWETYLVDGGRAIPWDWSLPAAEQGAGVPAWSEPYGFVPMVWTRHIEIRGLDFGLSEFHAATPKIFEADDQASSLNDQILKVVRPKWLFAGMRAPARDDAGQSRLDLGAQRRYDDERVEKDDEGAIYAKDPNAKGQPLVATIQIGEAGANAEAMVKAFEKHFPELRFEWLRAGGEVSGEALRVARQPVETKIGRRRSRYDADLARLNMMAVAIGGHAYATTRDDRFAVFAAFGLGSYAAGVLDHQIGPRPVFGEDPFERTALRTAVYGAVEVAIRAGIPRKTAWREAGYTDDQIAEMEREADAQAEADAAKAERFRQAAGFDNANPDDQRDDVTEDDQDADEDDA